VFDKIANARLRARFQQAARGFITEVNCFGYAGLAAAYDHGEPWRQALLAYLRGNYQLVREFVQTELPAITFRPMEATYLAWFDVSRLGLKDPAGHFEQHGVGLSDGTPFGAPQHLRLNFGCPRTTLEAGMAKIKGAVADQA